MSGKARELLQKYRKVKYFMEIKADTVRNYWR